MRRVCLSIVLIFTLSFQSFAEPVAEKPRDCKTSLSQIGQPVKAFTLVEMLVVIGVVTVLVGILLPTVSKVRRQAEQVVCLSNINQLGRAFIMYANDNHGYYPRPSQNIVPRPEDWIYYNFNRGLHNGPIVQYLSRPFSPGVYRCPSDDVTTHDYADRHLPAGLTSLPGVPRYEFSYSVNTQICRMYGVWNDPTTHIDQGTGQGPDHSQERIAPSLRQHPSVNATAQNPRASNFGRPEKFSRIRRPDTKVLIGDESSGTIDDGCLAWPESQGVANGQVGNMLSLRHYQRGRENDLDYKVGTSNVGFADGHAGTIRRQDYFTPAFYDPRH